MTNKINALHSRELSPETIGFLEQFANTFASLEKFPIPVQRKKIKELFCPPEENLEPIKKKEDRIILGRNGSIKLRFFSPETATLLPVIVFFHRGGFVYGSLDESESICRRLANAAHAIVIAVEYRLSPEHKFPVPLEDCFDAAEWIFKNAETFSGDPNTLILAGESAGGNLVAATTLMNLQKKRFKAAGQILLYPCLTSDLDKKRYDESLDKWLISYDNMQFFWQMYLSALKDGDHPLASPLKSMHFENLPPCLIVTADHDALKEEAFDYAKKLQDAGVKVQLNNYQDVIHGFLDFPLAESVKQQAIEDIINWIATLNK